MTVAYDRYGTGLVRMSTGQLGIVAISNASRGNSSTLWTVAYGAEVSISSTRYIPGAAA